MGTGSQWEQTPDGYGLSLAIQPGKIATGGAGPPGELPGGGPPSNPGLSLVVQPAYTSFIASGSQPITVPFSILKLLSSAAPAARKPNTASSTTGFLVRTASKKFRKWSYWSEYPSAATYFSYPAGGAPSGCVRGY